MNLETKLRKNYVNFRGWSTSRKIVVIESDDWGSIRISSKEAYEALVSKGYPLHKSKFSSIDTLECTDDLIDLFAVLEQYKDLSDNHPVITANALVANPNFECIRKDDFNQYHYETIEETYERYGDPGLLKLWLEKGIKENLLYPQFHGREHLNPKKWLRLLRGGNQMELDAFNQQTLLGLSGSHTLKKDAYMAAFEYDSEVHKKEIEKITIDGLSLFERLFGFRSKTFIPSQSKQGLYINKVLVEHGVCFNQAGQFYEPAGNGQFKRHDRYWGDKDKFGMVYWRRNCTFEPYKETHYDPVERCLEEIKIAFRWGKPAVINSHRINYVSRLDKKHQTQSLCLLDDLLKGILNRWPDVQFINSAQLAELMLKSKL